MDACRLTLAQRHRLSLKVLCEVDNARETIEKVDSILKPDGRVYFMEHIGCEHGTWERSIQDLVNPLYRVARGGCNCNVDSLKIMQECTNWTVVKWDYDHIKVMLGKIVVGLAKKKES